MANSFAKVFASLIFFALISYAWAEDGESLETICESRLSLPTGTFDDNQQEWLLRHFGDGKDIHVVEAFLSEEFKQLLGLNTNPDFSKIELAEKIISFLKNARPDLSRKYLVAHSTDGSAYKLDSEDENFENRKFFSLAEARLLQLVRGNTLIIYRPSLSLRETKLKKTQFRPVSKDRLSSNDRAISSDWEFVKGYFTAHFDPRIYWEPPHFEREKARRFRNAVDNARSLRSFIGIDGRLNERDITQKGSLQVEEMLNWLLRMTDVVRSYTVEETENGFFTVLRVSPEYQGPKYTLPEAYIKLFIEERNAIHSR